jgi:menaquinone-dependent protoporphyrinogen IX oxidase
MMTGTNWAACMVTVCVAAALGAASDSTAVETTAATVLIAAQHSEFKDALVREVLQGLGEKAVAVEQVELGGLKHAEPGRYAAVVIVSTVKAWHLSRKVRRFLTRCTPELRGRVILVSTAAREDWKTKEEGVQAVTSASEMDKAAQTARFVLDAVQGALP